MNVGSSRRVSPLVAIVLAAGAAGCTCTRPTRTNLSPCPVKNKEHVVLLRAEEQKQDPPTPEKKHWKAIAHPNFLTIRGYDPEKPDSVVYWAYRDMTIDITFEDSAMGKPACSHGVCTLQLPENLKLKPDKYKYTITGEFDDKTPLDPNDPDIEVDR